MRIYYRNKTSKIILIMFLLVMLLNIISSLLREDYIFIWIWGALTAAFLVLLFIFIFQPYVILTFETLKIWLNPFVMREYRLNRLQYYRKEVQHTLLAYEREDGSKETIKLDHFSLDKDDFAAILAALEKPDN